MQTVEIEIIPIFEMNTGIDFQFGVGGSSKINSSSWILENWNNQREEKWDIFKP